MTSSDGSTPDTTSTGPITLDELHRIQLTPNDTLLLHFKDQLTTDAARRVTDQIRDVLPGTHVLIMTGGDRAEIIATDQAPQPTRTITTDNH